MRTIWLASTALLMTAGIACAQSTSTSTPSPAPTGSMASPNVTPPGASPGNMAPSPSNAGTMSMSSAAPAKANETSAPAPNGATNAPDVTAAAAPGTAPGKTAPNSGSTGDATVASSQPSGTTGTNTPSRPIHHHWSGSSVALPADASATTYLHIAKSAIWHHNVSLADDALSHAETRLLDRSVPQGEIAADDSPSIQSIESARQALHAGNYTQASADTKQAASAVSGM
jgi:hypothetical protein